MDESLISVIVPVFNVEEYLAACLDSIVSQSYRNLEIIVIDDGSTDFSLKIAQSYAEKDDRIIVYSYHNEGLSEARNRGLSVATGEYVTFVDSDDMLLPKSLEVLHSISVKYTLDITEGKFIKGLTVPTYIHYNQTVKTQILTPVQAIEKVLYQKGALPSSCGKLYKRELFNDIKYLKGIIYEDLDLSYKILGKAKNIGIIDFPVYFYRVNDASILHKWNPNRLDVLSITENMETYVKENYPELLKAAKDRRLSANFNMFALCSIHGDKENAKKCWQHIKENRIKSLLNPKVRLKNKAGILLSFLGKDIFNLTVKNFYK